jgi:hypothetical protein
MVHCDITILSHTAGGWLESNLFSINDAQSISQVARWLCCTLTHAGSSTTIKAFSIHLPPWAWRVMCRESQDLSSTATPSHY